MPRGLCNDCDFWDRIGSSSEGECHRYAPGARLTGATLWPRTVADTGCGEFEPRKPTAAATADPNAR